MINTNTEYCRSSSKFSAVMINNIFFIYIPVRGDRVEVSFPGRSLVNCQLTAESWELLWELRTSIQTMLYRNLSNPNHTITKTSQDGKLISLLVDLLNNTDPSPFAQSNNSDSEVD